MMNPTMITPTPGRSDVALLRAARADAQAFGTFYRENAERVYLWALRHTGDAQTATDITAETFAAALAGLPRFRGTDPGSGVAWVFGIARNLVRHWHHDRRVDASARQRLGMQVPAWVPAEVSAVDDRLDAAQLSDRLAQAVAELPAGLRDALMLHVVDERSHREVAALLGISEANARVRITRALRRVRARLDMDEREGS